MPCFTLMHAWSAFIGLPLLSGWPIICIACALCWDVNCEQNMLRLFMSIIWFAKFCSSGVNWLQSGVCIVIGAALGVLGAIAGAAMSRAPFKIRQALK